MRIDFSSSSAVVIGDVMLDTYFTGSVKRISPEAPVPVINVKKQNSVPGGAANVAHNLAALKSKVTLLSSTGDDENKRILSSSLDSLGISHIFTLSARPTTTKIRVVGNHQQIARLDFEETHSISDAECDNLIKKFRETLPGSGIVIISDYAKGVCTEKMCRTVIDECKKNKITVLIDPKGNNWEKYRGADIITPNANELSDICGFDCRNETDTVVSCAEKIRKEFDINSILVTRSEKGITLVSDKGVEHFTAQAREVYDVSGAGDTAVSVLGAALSSGFDISQSVRLSNIASGISVGKFGTSPVSCEEISAAVYSGTGKKIFTPDEFIPVLKNLREKGRAIVFTNGCFDILHRGHVEYLKEAKSLGDFLVVGLNTDASVKKLKGSSRPINNQEDRAAVLTALNSVDYVIYFGEDTPHDLIKTIRPDFLVKGGDYTPETVVGREFAKNTVIIKFVDGYSTTSTISKMKAQ